jgi:glycosyltransferase involved in cell wall biosynthesis
VVAGWDTELAAVGVPCELRVYDDGSRDRTGELLEALARERPRVVAIRQPNRGHGPTILRGYHDARGEWIFQVDSDDEISAEFFPEVWKHRDADLVLGYRVGRESSLGRRLVTMMSYWTVRLFFGSGVRDVNTPFRLYRRSALARLLPQVPADAFAPNVILCGLALREGLRITEVPVPHRGRRSGASHIVRLRLWQAAATAFVQTVRVALRARAGRTGSP